MLRLTVRVHDENRVCTMPAIHCCRPKRSRRRVRRKDSSANQAEACIETDTAERWPKQSQSHDGTPRTFVAGPIYVPEFSSCAPRRPSIAQSPDSSSAGYRRAATRRATEATIFPLVLLRKTWRSPGFPIKGDDLHVTMTISSCIGRPFDFRPVLLVVKQFGNHQEP